MPASRIPPLVLHLDLNKTVIIADNVKGLTPEFGVAEAVSTQFWGSVRLSSDPEGQSLQPSWKWDGNGPSLEPLEDEDEVLVSYAFYCKQAIADKALSKRATATFELVKDPSCRELMEALRDKVIAALRIPEAQQGESLKQVLGEGTQWRLIFPSVFRLVTHLQRKGRHFAVFFRTFGSDSEIVRREWDAFCARQHPLYNEMLEDTGPMDGSQPYVPDRRVKDIHTMYRDKDGGLLALNVQTNGPEANSWDKWGRSGASEDTRGGRQFFAKLGVQIVDGLSEIKDWFKEQAHRDASHFIREDWAWWHHHGEVSTAGKLLLGIRGLEQIFFDDNIGEEDLKIVDARAADNHEPLSPASCIGVACVRVDPIQAILDEDYFIKALDSAEGRPEVLWDAPLKTGEDSPKRVRSSGDRSPKKVRCT